MRIGISLRIGSFLALFLVEIIALMVAFSMVINAHKGGVKQIYGQMERGYLVDELRVMFYMLIMPVNDYLVVGGDSQEPENFKALSSKVDEQFRRMEEKGFLFDSDAEYIRNLRAAYDQIKKLANEVFSMQNAIGSVEAGALMESIDAIADRAIADAETMHQETYKKFSKVFQNMRKTERAMDILILAGVLLNVFLVFSGLIYFRKTISYPIAVLGKAAREVGEGDLSRRVSIHSEDELGDLSAAFNSMTENLTLLQHQLVQTEKMASLGTLAAGVAHELKNPLAIITQGLEYVRRYIPQDDNILLTYDKLMQSVIRMDIIIKGLLDFSRSTVSEFELSDAGAVIEDVLSLTEHQLGLNRIKVIRRYADNIPQLNLDRNKIRQVILNIIINAKDAMRQGGVITILTAQREAAGKRKVVIEINDTGCGIPADNLKKAFDPFFTTKQKIGGTGLGLSISRGIIEMHKGNICIESEVGKGTRVIIELPSIDSK